MTVVEEPTVFGCEGSRLVGILHRPSEPRARGVLLIVGGPQYRVGSHRQFVLLARHLASRGFPVLRFDYRAMGDSEGPETGFLGAGDDVRAALRTFADLAHVQEIVVWGLCDAASAALLHACGDERVRGLVLVNPWVRQDHTEARTHLRHYYASRVFDRALWRKLLAGELNIWKSGAALVRTVLASVGRAGSIEPAGAQQEGARGGRSFVTGMLDGLEAFRGKVLLILSGDDLTAAEFKDLARASRRWSRALARESIARRDFPDANHTFSTAAWRDAVSESTAQWMESW